MELVGLEGEGYQMRSERKAGVVVRHLGFSPMINVAIFKQGDAIIPVHLPGGCTESRF